jgi:hypothetical protein
MVELATGERFEEAADTRDRANALVTALRRQRSFAQLRRTESLVVEVPGHGGSTIRRGRLVSTWQSGANPSLFDQLDLSQLGSLEDERAPIPKDLVDELLVVSSWLEQRASQIRLVSCEGELVSPTIPLPSFQPRKRSA